VFPGTSTFALLGTTGRNLRWGLSLKVGKGTGGLEGIVLSILGLKMGHEFALRPYIGIEITLGKSQ